MKKIALLLCFVLIFTILSACSDQKPLPDGETELFSTDEEIYEAMTGAAEEGNFKTAVAYYGTGGAGADKEDARDWYLYSLVMDEYNENGCIGYPLDMLTEKLNPSFSPAKKMVDTLKTQVSEFNGVYHMDGSYLYIYDGKIAVSIGTQITDYYFCAYEVSVKDGVFFWTERKSDGTHNDLYTITKNGGKVVVTPVEENKNDMYSGTYDPFNAEMPMLCY
ncbi:MAG: hypothetical protein IKW03_02160 [Clostridia bacterium]|nr:hypothetical protein [Clostridia bacterium]